MKQNNSSACIALLTSLSMEGDAACRTDPCTGSKKRKRQNGGAMQSGYIAWWVARRKKQELRPRHVP